MEEIKNVMTDDRRAAMVGHLMDLAKCLYLDGAEDLHNGADVNKTFPDSAGVVEIAINKIIDSVMSGVHIVVTPNSE
jgi:hypothetical protein